MRIYGLDFTSAPKKRKPITCAVCWFEDQILKVETIQRLESFKLFDELLASEGPWCMAIDFPFSQPREWIQAMGWPTPWASYVELISKMPPEAFYEHIKAYRTHQPKGKKHHLRAVDKLAKSCSPMMIDYTPVGRMFYHGAPRLLRSGASIPLLYIRNSDRYIYEGYPALVARRFVGKQSYKSDDRRKAHCEVRRAARRRIVDGLKGPELVKVYGFKVDPFSIDEVELIAEPGADQLDSILCAIQAAWAQSRWNMDHGFPEVPGMGVTEGWIPDPALLPEGYDFFEQVK